jgi:phosphopantetheine adenylyltransferase
MENQNLIDSPVQVPINSPPINNIPTHLQTLDKITINLKILSELKPHDKLVFRDGIFDIDRWDYSQPLRRWYNADSRQTTIENLNNFINSVFTFIEEIYTRENVSLNDNETVNYGQTNRKSKKRNNVFSEENNQTLLSISHNLQNATNGLRNLITTYESDTLISKKLQHFISNIESRVQRINNLMILNTGSQDVVTRQPLFQSYNQSVSHSSTSTVTPSSTLSTNNSNSSNTSNTSNTTNNVAPGSLVGQYPGQASILRKREKE